MIRTRVRKIFRDVWARKGRTILVSTAIFIGVAGTIALFSMSDIIVSQLREDINEEELAMVQVAVSANPDIQLDNAGYLDLLMNSSKIPGVTQVVGGMEDNEVSFKLDPADEDFESGMLQANVVLDPESGQLKAVFGKDDWLAPEDRAPIEPLRLGNGAYPAPGTDEVAVETRLADDLGLEVGQTIYFRVLSPPRNANADNRVGDLEAWTISGIVFDAYALDPSMGIYADLTNANYLTGRSGFGDIWARFESFGVAEDEYEEFQQFIAELPNRPYSVVFAMLEDPKQNQLIMQAQQLSSLMGFLALMSLIVSGFLVVNVITSLVVEQKRQIGVMKSMGATRTDNFMIYSGIAFAYGLIGVIPGVLIGIPGGNAAANALAPELNTLLEGFNVSPPSIILGIIVGLLVPVLASLIPVFNGTKVQILDAMTDLGIDANYGSGPIAKLISRLPIPITVRQGLSNVSLKKSRLAFTVLTLSIAAGAFMGIWAIFETFTDGIGLFIDNFNIHVGIAPWDARDPDEFEALLLDNFQGGDMDYISSIQPLFQLQVEFEGYDPGLSAFGPPGIFAYGYDVKREPPGFNFSIDEGTPLEESPTYKDEIVLSSALATHMDVGVGGRVTIQVPGGKRALRVAAISDFPLDQAWLHWETLAEIAGYTYDTIEPDTVPDEAKLLSPITQGEAGNYIKYASFVQVEGQENPSAMMPGFVTLGMTPSLVQFLQIEEGGQFFTAGQKEIIVSSAFADSKPDGRYQPGDQVTVVSLTGAEETFTIAGVFDLGFLAQAAAPGEGATPAMPEEMIGMFWQDLSGLDGVTVNSKLRPQFYSIITPIDDPSAKELDDVIDDMNEVLAEKNVSVFALNFVELTDQISQAFTTIQAILSAVAGLIALVGALGLLTTLSMSVYERQKEIGVMRSIGAGSTTISIQFLTEGLLVGIIAWIVGLPLMLLIQFGLLEVIGARDIFPVEFSLTATIIGLVGMVVITTIASLWPSITASRKTVSDILRYQ